MATACSSPDPGQVTFSERQHGSGDTASGGGSSGDQSSGGTSSGGSSGASGTSGGTDGGSSGMPDPFFGTDAFQPGMTGSHDSTAGSGHMGAGSPGATGIDCTTCHKAGGSAAADIWTACGTVYTTKAGTTPVGEGVEVRINDSTGKKVASAYTDASGNFAFDATTLPTFPAGGKVGVRNAKSSNVMQTNPTGACNSTGCHNQGSLNGRASVVNM
jgi:hypothetical protein